MSDKLLWNWQQQPSEIDSLDETDFRAVYIFVSDV